VHCGCYCSSLSFALLLCIVVSIVIHVLILLMVVEFRACSTAMASQQSALTRFLYEARVPVEDASEEAIPGDVNGVTSNVVA
jgi:hypothetical protein